MNIVLGSQKENLGHFLFVENMNKVSSNHIAFFNGLFGQKWQIVTMFFKF
jgi:hypothetical protein